MSGYNRSMEEPTRTYPSIGEAVYFINKTGAIIQGVFVSEQKYATTDQYGTLMDADGKLHTVNRLILKPVSELINRTYTYTPDKL